MIETLTPRERQVYESIAQYVATETGISARSTEGPSRTIAVMAARRMVAWRLRKAGLSYYAIGRALGGRDHTSVMYLVETFDPTARVECDAGDHDAAEGETAEEARVRVARQLAAGQRCPRCWLLLPCDHMEARAA